jgi:hypothetical protein
MNYNYYAVAALQHTEDVSEGVTAFLERRPALFNRTPLAGEATADVPG